jgi:hypothetical protein
MATLGKPAINPIRELELTGVAAAMSAARQRIELLEKEVSAAVAQLGQSSLSASQSSASIANLQSQISVLRSRVDALGTDDDVQTFRADGPIDAGTAVYTSSAGGVSQVSPGDPVAIYGVIGVAVASAVEGANVSVRLRGTMQIVGAVFEPGGPVYVGLGGLTQFPDYINVAIPVGVAVTTDRLDVAPGWPALQHPGVYSEYEFFLPATWGLVRDAVTLAADLNAASNGIVVRTGVDDIATRSLSAPAAGLTISNSDGVAGNPTFVLANDLAALEGLAGTGLAARTAADTWAQRTITAGTGIAVTNGDGVSGNPTVAIDPATLLANPSGLIGMTAVNGTATTAPRSDGRHAIDPAIAPTWTGAHTFNLAVTAASFIPTSSSVPSNGLYLSAANAPAISSNGNSRLVFESAGVVRPGGNATQDLGSASFLWADYRGVSATFTSTVTAAKFQPTSSAAPTHGMYLPAAGALGFAATNFGFNQNSPQTFNQNQVGGLVVGDGTSSPGLTIFSSTTGLCAVSFADGTSGDQQYRGSFEYDQGADTLYMRAAAIRYLSVNQNGGGNVRLPLDNQSLEIGAGRDLQAYHDGTNSVIRNDTGALRILMGATEASRWDTSGNFIVGDNSAVAKVTVKQNSSDTNFLDSAFPAASSGLYAVNESSTTGAFCAFTFTARNSGSELQSGSFIVQSVTGSSRPDIILAGAVNTAGTTEELLRITGSSGDMDLALGNFDINTAGKGIRIKEGSNAKQGSATLVAGTVTVSNTSVTASSRIQITRSTAGGTLGHLSYTLSAGTSFTVTSSSASDTSTFVYTIFEPS